MERVNQRGIVGRARLLDRLADGFGKRHINQLLDSLLRGRRKRTETTARTACRRLVVGDRGGLPSTELLALVLGYFFLHNFVQKFFIMLRGLQSRSLCSELLLYLRYFVFQIGSGTFSHAPKYILFAIAMPSTKNTASAADDIARPYIFTSVVPKGRDEMAK